MVTAATTSAYSSRIAISSTFLLDPTATAFVTLFSGATRAQISQIVSSEQNDSFGWDVTTVGDEDADGFVDLAIGAPQFLASPAALGRVEVHSMTTGVKLAEFSAAREGQAFGKTILRLPDLRPNGFDEILLAGDGLVQTGGAAGGLAVFDGSMGGDCVPSIPYCGQVVPNSIGALATLSQVSNADLSGSMFRLLADDLPVGSTTLLLASLDTGFVTQPGGSAGNLFLGGSIGRFTSLVQQAGPSGRIVFRPDLSQMPTPTPSPCPASPRRRARLRAGP